jgi:hypothetical protein
MKSKLFLSVSVSLLLLLHLKAQIKDAASRTVDSLDMLSFKVLVSYVSTDTQNLRISETQKNFVPHLGEEHMLVTPVLTYPGTSAQLQDNMSYDNFLPSVYNKEPTHGSPFLIPVYVPGLVINQAYNVVNKTDYLYNYDKVSGNLLLKRGNESPIAVNRDQVYAFCLKIDKGGFIFMRVPLINVNEYFEVIYKGLKYSSYKLYKNKFINANQKTNGYISDGKDYDEYQDIETYYLVDERKQESTIYELTKKSIKKSLSSETTFVDQYFKDHRYDDITEIFVSHLLEALNK